MKYGDLSWEEALKVSHETLLQTHPRSSEKLIPPHQWIKDTMEEYLGSSYEYYSIGKNKNNRFNREFKVPGKLYDKNSDITIVKNGKVVGSISFKFVASNYSQNSNNYFENLLGECFNIQSNGIPFCHVFVIRDEIPYYDNKKKVKRYEEFTEHNLEKYLKADQLSNEIQFSAVPNKLSITVIHISGDKYPREVIHPTLFKNLSSEEQKNILDNLELNIVDYKEKYSPEYASKLENMEIHKRLKEFAEIIKANSD